MEPSAAPRCVGATGLVKVPAGGLAMSGHLGYCRDAQRCRDITELQGQGMLFPPAPSFRLLCCPTKLFVELRAAGSG